MSTAAAKRYLYSHFGGSSSPPNPVQKHTTPPPPTQPESEFTPPPPPSSSPTQKSSDPNSVNCKRAADDSFISSNLNEIKMESESSINILAAAAVAAQQFPLTNHHHHNRNLFQTKLIDQNQSIPFNGSITNGVPSIGNLSAFHHHPHHPHQQHQHQFNSSSTVDISSRINGDGDNNNLFYFSKLIPPPPPPPHHLTTGSDPINSSSGGANGALLNFGSLSPYFYHQYQQLYHHLNHSFWANSGSNLTNVPSATDSGSSDKKQAEDDDDNDDDGNQGDSAMNLVNKCKNDSSSSTNSPTNEIRVVDAHVPVIASTASYQQLSSNKSIENSDSVKSNTNTNTDDNHCVEQVKKLVDGPTPPITSKSMDDEGIDVDMEIDIGCNPSPPNTTTTIASSSTIVSNKMDQPITISSSSSSNVNQSRTSIKAASTTIANQKQQPKFLNSPTDNDVSASKMLHTSCSTSSSSDTCSDHNLSPTGSTGSSTSTNSLEQSSKRTLYQCQWSGCQFQCLQCHIIDQHVRVMHLKPKCSKNGDAVVTTSTGENIVGSTQKPSKKLMGPKHQTDISNNGDDNDEDMSDQELCFNEMEIISEDELLDCHNSSPQTTLSSMSSLSAVSTLSAGLSPGPTPCSPPPPPSATTSNAISNQNDDDHHHHSQLNLVSSPTTSLSSTTKIVAVPPQSSTDDVPMDLSLGAKTVGKPLSILLPPPPLNSVTKVTTASQLATSTESSSSSSSSSVAVASDLMVMVLNDKNDENPNHNPIVSGQPAQPASISVTNTISNGHVNVASTIIPPRMFHFVPSASPSSLSSSSSSSSSCSSSSSSSTSAYFSSTSSPTSSTKSWSAQYDISNNNNNNGAAVVNQISKSHLPTTTTTIQSQSIVASSSNTTNNIEPVSLVRNRLATPPPPPPPSHALESTSKPIMVINHKSSNVIKYGHAQTPATPITTVRQVNEEDLKRLGRKEDATKSSAFMVPMMNHHHHHNNNLHYLNHHHHLYNHTYMSTPNNSSSSNGITVPIKCNNKNLNVIGEGGNQTTTSNVHSSMINQSGATVILPRRRGRPPGSTNKKKKLLLQQQQQQQQQQQLICAMNPLNGTPFIASIAASLSPSNGATSVTKSSPQNLEFPLSEKFSSSHHQSQDSHPHHHHPLFGSLKGLVGAMGAAAAAAAAAASGHHHHRATNPLGIISPSLNNGSTASLTNGAAAGAASATVANRRPRGESRKCRKVYGMDNRQLWCTQCKWKKACSRFID